MVYLADSSMDAALAVIATCTRLDVCSGEPTQYSSGGSTGVLDLTLANVALTAGGGNGDWAIANGDTSGRKITCAQQDDLSITASGSATRIAHSVSGSTTLIWTSTCTSQALTSGGTVTVPAHKHEIADAA